MVKLILLDTDIIINFLRNKEVVVKEIKKLFVEGATLGCCLVNITELYAGVREKEKIATENFINNLYYFHLNKQIAKLAGEYLQNFSKRGITLSLADALIAATTIFYNLTLFTYNKKHYPMKEIKFYKI